MYVHNEVEKRIVSGSQILYGPVGVSSCSTPVGKPILSMTDGEEFPHDKITGPWPCKNMKDGRSGHCLIQPQFHFVPNGGCYRFAYTGDIGLFKRNVRENGLFVVYLFGKGEGFIYIHWALQHI